MIIQQDFDIRIILDKPLMAHLASQGEDTPCSSPIWFIYEDDKVWLFGLDTDSFIKRLITNPKCALSIVDFNLEEGILQHVGVRGTAKVGSIDKNRLNRFVGKYLGDNKVAWNEWFVDNVVNPINQMVEVTPESIVAKDVSYFKAKSTNKKYKIRIRPYSENDARALADIYYNTIHKINIKDYSEEQVDAWAPKSSLELEGWMKNGITCLLWLL